MQPQEYTFQPLPKVYYSLALHDLTLSSFASQGRPLSTKKFINVLSRDISYLTVYFMRLI